MLEVLERSHANIMRLQKIVYAFCEAFSELAAGEARFRLKELVNESFYEALPHFVIHFTVRGYELFYVNWGLLGRLAILAGCLITMAFVETKHEFV